MKNAVTRLAVGVIDTDYGWPAGGTPDLAKRWIASSRGGTFRSRG